MATDNTISQEEQPQNVKPEEGTAPAEPDVENVAESDVKDMTKPDVTDVSEPDVENVTESAETKAETEEMPEEQVAPLPDFSQMLQDAAASSIDLLKDVDLNVKIELGRVEMTVEDILHLAGGSVVELDKLAGDPVDVLVNEQLVARGEVLVVNDNFCVRINEIIPGVTERMVKL